MCFWSLDKVQNYQTLHEGTGSRKICAARYVISIHEEVFMFIIISI